METYVLVPWPECQEFMEEQWFYNEAILAVGAEEKLAQVHISYLPIELN